MDMRIDTDKGHIVEMRQDDFCRLDADSGESADGFECMGDFSAVFLHEFLCGLEEVFCFHSIIVYPSEHNFDFLGLEFQQVRWSFHDFKEFFRRFVHAFICHLCWEHDGCEELKRGLEIELYGFRRIELKYFIQDFISFCFWAEFHENSISKIPERHGATLYFLWKKYQNHSGEPKLAINQVQQLSVFIPLRQLLP